MLRIYIFSTLSNIEWVWEDNEIAWGIRSLTLPNKQSRDWYILSDRLGSITSFVSNEFSFFCTGGESYFLQEVLIHKH